MIRQGISKILSLINRVILRLKSFGHLNRLQVQYIRPKGKRPFALSIKPTIMGDLAVKSLGNKQTRLAFLKQLLEDVSVLDTMLREDMFEKTPIRIGAEQELAVINEDFLPSARSQEILDISEDEHLTSEIARFNLELNLDPFKLEGTCFSQTLTHLQDLLRNTKALAATKDQKILLTGILPTIDRRHLELDYMMPYDRYHLLSQMIRQRRGSEFEIHIQGIDELIASLDSVLFEACNTSFQLHLQVAADDFVRKYNWAQQISGPVLSIMTNSPILLGKALWMETRIALFRQSLDTRTASNHMRDKQARVFFGNHWLRNSISMLFKEHIARFPQLVTREIEEDSLKQLKEGKAPALRALRVHNGTVYNWNRPCYGRANNIPHLRIENRYVPSGPTPTDEVANFAFWIGLMKGMPAKYEDFYHEVTFDHAKDNFYRAARTGLDSVFNWFGKEKTGQGLILEDMLPMAEAGLHKMNVEPEDIRKFLGIIEKRAQKGVTGAHWQLQNFQSLRSSFSSEAAASMLTRGMYELQQDENQSLNDWPQWLHHKNFSFPQPKDVVGQIMNTDLFTVNEEEPLLLVRDLMNWHHIRHLPVENDDGELVGLISHRDLLKYDLDSKEHAELTVGDIMISDLITVERADTIARCQELMKENKIGCLPIKCKNKICGLITDTDLRNLGLW